MNNKGYITKGLILTILGFLIAFLPKVITYTLYGICIIIALFCIFEVIQGITSGDAGVVVPSVIGSAVVIAAIIFLPKIILFGTGIIGGFVIAGLGISEIVKALSTGNGMTGCVIGIIMLIVGGICILNPFHAGSVVRVIVGIGMLLNGIFDLVVAYTIAKRKNNSGSGYIDVTGYTKDDK